MSFLEKKKKIWVEVPCFPLAESLTALEGSWEKWRKVWATPGFPLEESLTVAEGSWETWKRVSKEEEEPCFLWRQWREKQGGVSGRTLESWARWANW